MCEAAVLRHSTEVVATSVLLAAVATGCADVGPCAPGDAAAVRVEGFRDTDSGHIWTWEARISGISINGQQVDELESLVQYPAGNVAVERAGLACTMPCSFGAAPGRYEFNVEVMWYHPESVRVEVEAAEGQEACSGTVAAPALVVPDLEPVGTTLESIIVTPIDSSS